MMFSKYLRSLKSWPLTHYVYTDRESRNSLEEGRTLRAKGGHWGTRWVKVGWVVSVIKPVAWP